MKEKAMDNKLFTWVPAYEAIATALLGYEDRQDELLPIVEDVIGEQHSQMDPLTFMSMFNGKLKNEARRKSADGKVL